MAPAANVVQTLRSDANHLRDFSPVTETFSTPPQSPLPPSTSGKDSASSAPPLSSSLHMSSSAIEPPPALERRASKTIPSAIQTVRSGDSTTSAPPGVTLDISSPIQASPVTQRTPRPEQTHLTNNPTSSSSSSPALPSYLHAPRNHTSNHLNSPASPCFVHSLLDRGASLRNFIELNSAPSPSYTTASAGTANSTSPPVSDSGHGGSAVSDRSPLSKAEMDPDSGLGVSRTLDSHHADHRSRGSSFDSQYSISEEEDEGNSLTKQLAETAVGVRELSKQLGELFFYFSPYT